MCEVIRFRQPTSTPLSDTLIFYADSPKKQYYEAPQSYGGNELNVIDRTLAAEDGEFELRKGLRTVMLGSKPTLPPGANDLDVDSQEPRFLYKMYDKDTTAEATYRPGYVRGANDEDDEMLDADPVYDDYDGGGHEWAEQEYDERYPDGYDDYYGEYEGEELGARRPGRRHGPHDGVTHGWKRLQASDKAFCPTACADAGQDVADPLQEAQYALQKRSRAAKVDEKKPGMLGWLLGGEQPRDGCKLSRTETSAQAYPLPVNSSDPRRL